jgi:hypothetical protein
MMDSMASLGATSGGRTRRPASQTKNWKKMLAAGVQAAIAAAVFRPVRKHWVLLLALGILMIVLGVLGFHQPFVYTVATTIFFSSLLLVTRRGCARERNLVGCVAICAGLRAALDLLQTLVSPPHDDRCSTAQRARHDSLRRIALHTTDAQRD